MSKGKLQVLFESGDHTAVIDAVQQGSCETVEEAGLDALSGERQAIYCCALHFILTLNGGYQSVFNGSYNGIVPHVAGALRKIGLEAYGDRFATAVKNLFPSGIPEDEDAYDEHIESLYDSFEETEDESDYEDPFEEHEEVFWKRYNEDEGEPYRVIAQYVLNHYEQLFN